jgi:hypothetical protein
MKGYKKGLFKNKKDLKSTSTIYLLFVLGALRMYKRSNSCFS